jgi:DMSO/TMAO reductase YedYZ molybdopterin-dependent catalytic subunit
MTKNKKNQAIPIKKTITRRSILDWMGKSVVLGLGSEMLLGCDYSDVETEDGTLINTEGTTLGDGGAAYDGGTVFKPGEAIHEVYDDFVEYTVDPQDLISLIETWKLTVDGLVETPIVLNFGELLSLDRFNTIADFHCVTGWSVFDVPWNGIHMASLVEMAKTSAEVTHVTFHTVNDIYNESLPLDEALEPKTMLAFGIGGSTLPLAHGFPLRLIVPRKFGYKSAKYVYRIEFTNKALGGYWEQRNYGYQADVPRSRLRPGKY